MLGRALVVVAALASTASADTQKLFSLKATLGVYDGFGAGIGVGDRHLGVQVIGGWQPLFVASKTGDISEPPDLDAYSTFQANADVYVLLAQPSPRAAIGLTAGYKGSTELGHGGGIGFYITVDAQKRLSFFIIGGVTWFPDGEERLRANQSIPMDQDFVFPGPALNAGANVGVDFGL